MRFFENANYDFIKWRWHALVLSSAVIIGGFVLMLLRGGMPLGIDFTGGTIVVLKFQQHVSDQQVRDALDVLPGEKVVQQYGDPAQNEILIRFPQTEHAEQGFGLEASSHQAVTALEKANIGKFEVLNTEVVGPIVGADLQRKGLYATIASILGLSIYIALRFRFIFAIGALAATFHDIFVVLAMMGFLGYELSLNVVAAILTITGYSVNDTIVIFDRVRENVRLMRREPLDKIVNASVNQTLGRTVITATTTFLAVLGLYLFGGEVLRGFAVAMLVGVVTGTYSTIFIAATIAIILSRRELKARKAAAPASGRPAGAAPDKPAAERPAASRSKKSGRNVRVS
jgi:preprotein translocase subunit SecF